MWTSVLVLAYANKSDNLLRPVPRLLLRRRWRRTEAHRRDTLRKVVTLAHLLLLQMGMWMVGGEALSLMVVIEDLSLLHLLLMTNMLLLLAHLHLHLLLLLLLLPVLIMMMLMQMLLLLLWVKVVSMRR